MATTDAVPREAPAQALALILSADGSVHERALGLLEQRGAFDRLGVSRDRFAELAQDCAGRLAPGLCEHSWLSADDTATVEALLDAVARPEDRLLVCGLAAAAMEDGSLVTHGMRLVLDHALAHWRIDPAPAGALGR
jgi:hypothetical protein